MRYYKVIQYGDGEEYSTKEMIIDEPTFRQYQKLIAEGKERIVLEDRIISVSSIKEIVPADDDVAEYKKMGITIDGVLEGHNDLKKLTSEVRGGEVESLSDYFKKTHFSFYKKMGWKHTKNCVCQTWLKEERERLEAEEK